MPEVEVAGGEQLAALYRRVREAGDNDLRRELLRGIRVAVKPLPVAVKAAARSTLPSRGGLAGMVAGASITSRTRTTASRQQDVGVRLIGQRERDRSKAARKGKKGAERPPSRFVDIAAVDRGVIRHPVFGNREAWVSQQVRPGFWSGTINERADEVERDIVQAMDRVAAKIADGRGVTP